MMEEHNSEHCMHIPEIMMNPASWDASDVEAWAQQVGLSENAVSALRDNEVDGPTLVTLSKEELQSDLCITSLPARRYLWDLILSLRSHQNTSDLTKAIDVLETEIDTLSFQGLADVSAGGNVDTGTSEEVTRQLRSDAAQQRQIISDHLMALRLQSSGGQQTYEDAELALSEENRLRQLAIQSEFDMRYAQSLDRPRSDDSNETKNQVASLFGLSIQACVSNKVNVAEALANGHIRIIPRLQDLEETNAVENMEDEMTELLTDNIEEKRRTLDSLPYIDRCNVCWDGEKQGFHLACDHSLCVNCMKELFLTAVRDSSLLPLRCCEVPIDMNASRLLLQIGDVTRLSTRMSEINADDKMYCPSCNRFINLDLVDAEDSTELLCVCRIVMCTSCKTAAHPNVSCAQNRAIVAGDDALLLEHARDHGWRQCPNCSVMIELTHGCYHVTCAICTHEFCFNCLSTWDESTRQCSSGTCEVWDEDRLLAAGEARVQAEENARQMEIPAPARRERVQRAMRALQENEGCYHNWERRNGYLGNCERCGYDLPCYGMRCTSDCETIVCYTCANFRIPTIGWR